MKISSFEKYKKIEYPFIGSKAIAKIPNCPLESADQIGRSRNRAFTHKTKLSTQCGENRFVHQICMEGAHCVIMIFHHIVCTKCSQSSFVCRDIKYYSLAKRLTFKLFFFFKFCCQN